MHQPKGVAMFAHKDFSEHFFRMTEAEYLAYEAASEVRHEYVGDWVVSMAGASLAHERIVRNVLVGLEPELRQRGCEPLGSNIRVKTPSKMRAYPDITILCGEPHMVDDLGPSLTNPAVVIEILSPSTADFEFTEYVLIWQDEKRIEIRRRQPDGTWTLGNVTGDDLQLTIQSLGITLLADVIYRGVF
jgi:Uma2 family endonuclease